jgi:hypothetical protein
MDQSFVRFLDKAGRQDSRIPEAGKPSSRRFSREISRKKQRRLVRAKLNKMRYSNHFSLQ